MATPTVPGALRQQAKNVEFSVCKLSDAALRSLPSDGRAAGDVAPWCGRAPSRSRRFSDGRWPVGSTTTARVHACNATVCDTARCIVAYRDGPKRTWQAISVLMGLRWSDCGSMG
ncbi:hypothetical protein MRB53_040303 [Persea americana]|nr:hypothetical protein MRB53_040303 [Persea americana]